MLYMVQQDTAGATSEGFVGGELSVDCWIRSCAISVIGVVPNQVGYSVGRARAGVVPTSAADMEWLMGQRSGGETYCEIGIGVVVLPGESEVHAKGSRLGGYVTNTALTVISTTLVFDLVEVGGEEERLAQMLVNMIRQAVGGVREAVELPAPPPGFERPGVRG
jgi:hypothetical protein